MKLNNRQFVYNIIFVLVFTISINAQAEQDTGINFYRQGNYEKAIESLKKASKTNSSDAQVWAYLGLSYLKINDAKSAIKFFAKAVELNPDDNVSRFGLAYSHLLRNNLNQARNEAEKALERNPKNAEANYIIGMADFRNGSYNMAYERSTKSIQLNPNFMPSYLLKAESLISSFFQQAETVVKPASSRGEILTEASESLEKYLSRSNTDKQTKFYQEYLESINFYSVYYSHPENQIEGVADSNTSPNDEKIPIKILSKPRPLYTDAARQSGIQGSIKLVVSFSSDGSIKHIMVAKPLSHGLNEEAMKAARKIKFEPAKQNGKPVSVAKQVEYQFTLY